MNKGLVRMAVALAVIFGGVFGFTVVKHVLIKKGMASYVPPPVTVSAEPAMAEHWERSIQVVGTLHARQGVDLSAEVKGVVRNLAFRPGDTVEAGVLLVELDDRVEQANLRSLEAQLRLAEINYERDKRLIASKAISKTDFDTIEARLKDAQAQVDRTRAIIDKMHIRAPFRGRVGVPLVKVGSYVGDGDALVTFQAPDALYLEFSLPERYFKDLVLGQKVRFTTDSYPQQPFVAAISAINVKIDDNTRSVLVRADVAPFDAELLPGMFANAEVILEESVPVLAIPQSAITYNLYGNSVYVVRSGQAEDGSAVDTVERVYVTPSSRRGNRVAIAGEVSAGDRVVIAGQIKLSSGARVIVDNSIALKGR